MYDRPMGKIGKRQTVGRARDYRVERCERYFPRSGKVANEFRVQRDEDSQRVRER